jgi:hypothetical protein
MRVADKAFLVTPPGTSCHHRSRKQWPTHPLDPAAMSGRSSSADHDRGFAELVTEQRRHRNHPDGFWVASTDPAAAQHALVDTIARAGLHRSAVLSDGAARLVDRFGLLDWPSFLDIFAEQGPDAIIAQVRVAEGSDRTGNAGRVASDTTTPPPSSAT